MKIRLTLVRFFVLVALFLTVGRAHAQMSETEKKAAARAAYQEGVKLQDEGKAADALSRFESAQKLFDAPTHLLHIAECQALTGRLVESSETYETLARKTLPAGAPDAFVQAQQQGVAELAPLRARVPTLRVTTKPGPQQLQNLAINVNGVAMPVELLGIARPLNPGTYRFTAQASGWRMAAFVDVPLAEKETKTIELTLVQSGPAAAVFAPPVVGAPPPYVTSDQPATPAKPSGPTSTGFLFGIRGGASVPGGDVQKNSSMSDHATAGGAFGIDAYVRLVKMLLIGATFEYAGLGAPDRSAAIPVGATADTSAHATYIGLNLGILPNADRFSFIGDIGFGSRKLAESIKGNNLDLSGSSTGLEFQLGLGLSIPAGPIRFVPRANLGAGSFTSAEGTVNNVTRSADIPSNDRATHTFIFIGLAAYYSLDVGQKSP